MSQNTNQNEQWELLVFLLNKIRQQNKQTINNVAEITGIPKSHVSRFFSAKFEPKLGTFLKFAKAVNFNLCQFYKN